MFARYIEMDRSWPYHCALVGNFCLCCDDQHFSTALVSNTPLRHFSTTPRCNTSLQHVSTTLFSNALLQRLSTTLLYNTFPQYFSTTFHHNTSPQHSFTTLPCNTSPQPFSTTLLTDTSPQHSSPTFLSNIPLQDKNRNTPKMQNRNATKHNHKKHKTGKKKHTPPTLLYNDVLQLLSNTSPTSL